MKRFILLVLLAFSFAFSGCSKDDNSSNSSSDNNKEFISKLDGVWSVSQSDYYNGSNRSNYTLKITKLSDSTLGLSGSDSIFRFSVERYYDYDSVLKQRINITTDRCWYILDELTDTTFRGVKNKYMNSDLNSYSVSAIKIN